MPLSFICALLSVRIMLGAVGVSEYGLISLLIALQALLPFLDLGTGGAVLDGAAHYKATGDRSVFAARWNSAIRVTALSCFGLLAATIAVQAAGLWDRILGVSGDMSLGLAVVAIACINMVARPLQLAMLALQGLGNPSRVVFLQTLVPVISLGVVAIAATTGAPLAVYGASLAAGQLCAGAVALFDVARRLIVPVVSLLIGLEVADRSVPSRTVQLAAPMLVITLFVPLGSGLDRLILNHRSGAVELATYALIAQLLLPVTSLCQTAIQSLWADLARRRHESNLSQRYLRHVLVGVIVAAFSVAAGYLLLLPSVGRVVSGDAIDITYALAAIAAVVVLLQIVQVFPGSLLTTANGLRHQSWIIGIATIANVLLSWQLAAALGAAGVLVGTAIGFAIQSLLSIIVVSNVRHAHGLAS